jgi:small subunit ribosomal protein S25
MKGKEPIRRTIKYLESGRIVLKDQIKIFSVNYNVGHGFKNKIHEGAQAFIFWSLPQLQYKNPSVQVVSFKNMTPTPFIKCYYGKLEYLCWMFLLDLLKNILMTI